jgi:hypothetical protein
MLIAGNFAPGNAGVPFYVDIILPDAGHCFFIKCETTKALGVTLIAEQSAKIFKSVGAGL